MEFLIKSFETEKERKVIAELTSSKERIIKSVGRDFNRSVANIKGLVSLLEDDKISEEDFKSIQNYLAAEAKKLDVLVKDICA